MDIRVLFLNLLLEIASNLGQFVNIGVNNIFNNDHSYKLVLHKTFPLKLILLKLETYLQWWIMLWIYKYHGEK